MKTVAFFVRHFTERGTEVAIYDYAKYNEEILNNKSYIVCFSDNLQKRIGFPLDNETREKFRMRFTILELNDINDMSKLIKTYDINYFHTLTHGGGNDIYQFNNKTIWGECKTIKHCVFDTTYPESDYYVSISNYLNQKNNTNVLVIPHIVSLPPASENLRSSLNIPKEALVLGRYGGYSEFNLSITHEAIKQILEINDKIYFLFMNTLVFYEHPRIIYLEKNTDVLYKSKFINTCDAMIHARGIGETFGLSIAEFSIMNKPIITCDCGDLEHIMILKDKAIIYKTTEELICIFNNVHLLLLSQKNWNAYENFSPKKVMELFKEIIK